MRNVYRQFLDLIPTEPLQVGTVQYVTGTQVIVLLPGGAVIAVRGEAAAGQTIFVRDGVVEGPAPDLPIVLIDV